MKELTYPLTVTEGAHGFYCTGVLEIENEASTPLCIRAYAVDAERPQILEFRIGFLWVVQGKQVIFTGPVIWMPMMKLSLKVEVPILAMSVLQKVTLRLSVEEAT